MRALEDLEIAAPAARVVLSRLAERGLVKRDRRGRLAYYALSAAGQRLLEEGTRRIFSFGLARDADGTWTVLSYSIPESRRAVRDGLRKRLRFLGFASVRDGVWFSPRNHEQEVLGLLDELGLRANAELFIGRPAAGQDPGDLIARGWNLRALRVAYGEFLDAYAPYGRVRARRAMTERDAFVVRTRIVHDFRRFPLIDPELPEDVLPFPTQRAKAVALFHKVYDALAEPSEAHFAAQTRRAPTRR